MNRDAIARFFGIPPEALRSSDGRYRGQLNYRGSLPQATWEPSPPQCHSATEDVFVGEGEDFTTRATGYGNVAIGHNVGGTLAISATGHVYISFRPWPPRLRP